LINYWWYLDFTTSYICLEAGVSENLPIVVRVAFNKVIYQMIQSARNPLKFEWEFKDDYENINTQGTT
jgi:hypothetical protein